MNVQLTGSVFGFLEINRYLESDLRFALIPFYDEVTGESEGIDQDEYLTAKCKSEKYLSCEDAAYVVAVSESNDAYVKEIIKQIEEFAIDAYGAEYFSALSFFKNVSLSIRVWA